MEQKEEPQPVPKPKPKPRTKKSKSGKAPGSKVMIIEKGNFVLVFD